MDLNALEPPVVMDSKKRKRSSSHDHHRDRDQQEKKDTSSTSFTTPPRLNSKPKIVPNAPKRVRFVMIPLRMLGRTKANRCLFPPIEPIDETTKDTAVLGEITKDAALESPPTKVAAAALTILDDEDYEPIDDSTSLLLSSKK